MNQHVNLGVVIVSVIALTGVGVFLFTNNTGAVTNTNTSGGYSFTLTSPTFPSSSDTFTWVFDGTKPGRRPDRLAVPPEE